MTESLTKNIFVVNCDKNMFSNYFSRKKNSDIVNYYEIRQRLTNNDVFKTPPTDDVIEFQMIKRLNSFSKCKKTEFLFYYTDNLSMDVLNGLKYVLKGCEYTVNYHLLVEPDVELPKIHTEFNSVQKLENDKG